PWDAGGCGLQPELTWRSSSSSFTYQSRVKPCHVALILDWYRQLFHDFAIWAATSNSLIVGVASAAISTVIGTMAAFALHRYSFRGKAAFESLLQLPIVIPEIVMGVSLLAFFVLIE